VPEENLLKFDLILKKSLSFAEHIIPENTRTTARDRMFVGAQDAYSEGFSAALGLDIQAVA